MGPTASKMFEERGQQTDGQIHGAGTNNPLRAEFLYQQIHVPFVIWPIEASFITKSMIVPEKFAVFTFSHTKP